MALWGRVMILHLVVPKPEDKTYFTFGAPGQLKCQSKSMQFYRCGKNRHTISHKIYRTSLKPRMVIEEILYAHLKSLKPSIYDRTTY